MQRVLLTGIMIFLVAGISVAQDYPKVEIFGGYSLLKSGGSDVDDLLNAATQDAPAGATTSKWFKNGFDASFTYNLNRYVGIEAAFQHNSNDMMKFAGVVEQYPGDPVGNDYNAFLVVEDLSFMVGPKFAYRKNEKITPFAHVLFGINRIAVDQSLTINGQDFTHEFATETGIGRFSDVGFGFIAGGGIDVNVCKRIAIRPIQFDYLMGSHSRGTADFKLNGMKLSFGVVVRLGGK
jgi:opacity protein-like surface antigen